MNLYGYEFQRESDLAHHGIIGMKWGIRRYQNVDGTLTAAGRKRLNKKYDGNRNNYSKKDIKSWKRDEEGRLIREDDYYKWADGKRAEIKNENQKKTKEQRESELKAAYNANEKDEYSFNENGHEEKMMFKLQRQIFDYSFGEPGSVAVSPKAKLFEKEYDQWYDTTPLKKYSDEWRKEREKRRLEGCGVILQDLGYEDNATNRKYIYGIVYDSSNLPIDEKE